MSRCFPFPPLGYKLGGATAADADVPLIESIKLQREREQAKAERKKQKKKERREEKKQKTYLKSIHLSHDQKIDNGHDSDNSDKSTLTDEYGQQMCLQNPSSSLDSTQDSLKRKRQASPPAVGKQEGSVSRDGNVLKIRLPSQKQQFVDAVVVREAPSTDSPVQKEHSFVPNGVLPSKTDGDHISPVSAKAEAAARDCASALPRCNKKEKKLQRRESTYKHLMENCIPLQMDVDYDDEDWLLPRGNPEKGVEKKLKTSEDASSSCSRVALWPRAQLLPDADIYALPFTVPF